MVCPVICPPLILSGSILSKYFGLSDLIIGLWSGALIMLIFLITIDFLDKKKIKFLFRKPLLFFLFFFLSYYPLYNFNFIIYSPHFLFFDEFLIGSLLGVIILISSKIFNNYLLKRNKGKVYFKFQKIIIPIIFLLIVSLIIYLFKKIL